MPKISNNFNLDLDEIHNILKESPELEMEFNEESKELEILEAKKEELSRISRILNKSNGSIEDATSCITEIMHGSKYDNTRIKAAEIVLDLHEVRNKNGDVNKQPIINFNIISDEVQIGNIFNPQRS